MNDDIDLFPTGVDSLDHALGGGFGPGVHVVLARHNAGATALALQVTNGAINRGLRVLLVGDLDFQRSGPRRLAALRSGVGLEPHGSFRDAPDGLQEAWAAATHGQLFLLSTTTGSHPPPEDLHRKVLQEVERHRPAIVVIDGVQPTQMVVAVRGQALIAGARAAADRWKIPVLVMGHLLAIARSSKDPTSGKRPMLEHVGEYRALFEDAADTLLLLNRSSMDLYSESDMTPDGAAATLVSRGQAPVEVDFRWSRIGTRFI